MRVNKRDIVEVVFELPDGNIKIHPAIIISGENYYEAEEAFYAIMVSSKPYNAEYSVELTNEKVTTPFSKPSYAKCHLIQSFIASEIISKRGAVTLRAFDEIKGKILDSLFG
jgi:mRNA-degrading endonuclease toxin of MazEF toxin-antitoxin module